MSYRTRKQGDETGRRIVEFAERYIRANGWTPSSAEISDALGISHASVSRHMVRLIASGTVKAHVHAGANRAWTLATIAAELKRGEA